MTKMVKNNFSLSPIQKYAFFKQLFIACISSVIGVFMLVQSLYAQPSWLKHPPVSSSGKFYYVRMHGSTLKDAFIESFKVATHLYGVETTVDDKIEMEKIYENGRVKNKQKMAGTLTFHDKTILYSVVEEYFDDKKNRQYILMAFAKNIATPLPNQFRTHSVAASMFKSMLIPSWGQFAKNEYGKGFFFLTSLAAIAGATYYCETVRYDSELSLAEANTTLLKTFYREEMNAFELYRNVGIGAFGAVYLWNVFDAAFAQGRRYAFHQDPNRKWQLTAYAQPQHYGLAFQYKLF